MRLWVNNLPGKPGDVYEVFCDAKGWSASAGTFRVDAQGNGYVILTTAVKKRPVRRDPRSSTARTWPTARSRPTTSSAPSSHESSELSRAAGVSPGMRRIAVLAAIAALVFAALRRETTNPPPRRRRPRRRPKRRTDAADATPRRRPPAAARR